MYKFQCSGMIRYNAAKLENVVKIYVPTWSIFAGPVTHNIMEGLKNK